MNKAPRYKNDNDITILGYKIGVYEETDVVDDVIRYYKPMFVLRFAQLLKGFSSPDWIAIFNEEGYALVSEDGETSVLPIHPTDLVGLEYVMEE